MTGASFPGVMVGMDSAVDGYLFLMRVLFGSGVAVFLWSIVGISYFLQYPPAYDHAKRVLQPSLIIAGIVILVLTWALRTLPVYWFLTSIFMILFLVVFAITRGWFVVQLEQQSKAQE
jgi:hypothetical protein